MNFRRHTPALRAAMVAAACSVAVPAHAASKVIVQNNTTKTIHLDTTSTLGSSHWKKKATSVGPGRRKVIYETNRDEGVTSGKDFWFTTTVNDAVQSFRESPSVTYVSAPDKLRLQLRLRGSTVGSHMWQSVQDQWGHQAPWEDDDGKKWTSSWQIGGKKYGVKYWSFFTGGDSNVEYVLQERYPVPEGFNAKLTTEWKESHLNVLSYNVYMRPTSLFHNGQSIRAKLIPPKLEGYDVVVFQEAFDDDVRAELISGMKAKGYKYSSGVLGTDDGTAQDGGVVIVSRWPIVATKQKLFGSVCEGWDCEAQKGVLYAKIDKSVAPGRHAMFHVFGTHMQDGSWSIRKKQLKIMRDFIKAQKIPKSQAVLMAGDLNTDMANTSEFNGMLSILNAGYPSGANLRGHRYTHDGPANDLGDGSQSYYDYVLYSKSHRAATSASYAEVRLLRADDEWKEYETETAMWDISDHFPVYASYHFADAGLDFDPGFEGGEQAPATCKADADCPSGMKCVQVPARVQPTTAAKSTAPRGMAPVSKAMPGPTKSTATPSAATTTGPKRMRKPRMVGQCRVPPPR